MNNTQLYVSIGIPTLTVILAWLSNRSDINRLNDKVDRLGESLRTETTALRNDYHTEMAALRNDYHADMTALRNDWHTEMAALRNDHHKDHMTLMGYMVPLHERMAKLEPRG